jgi:3'-phosphoadenosine 5'-phosphosulfate sulfotransferase (PAPS reductase)/FAD synthetase
MSDIENHCVSISGGRTSGYLGNLFEKKRQNENINVEYIFCDTGAEHPKTYEFLRNMTKHWGVEITCLRVVIDPQHGVGPKYKIIPLDDCKQDLEPFLDICLKHGTPYITGMHCSDRLKSVPFDKYCNDKYGMNNYYRWLGMRIDEPGRIKNTQEQIDFFQKTTKKKARFKNIRYLANIDQITKQGVLDWWSLQAFDLGLDEHLGNCIFCPKKGHNKLALAARDEPEMVKKWVEMVSDKRIPVRDISLPSEVMYRGCYSISNIIDMYEDYERDDIAKTIRNYSGYDSGSCTESCEGIVPNLDLFDEI